MADVERISRHEQVAAWLASRSDHQVGLLVHQATVLGAGIGGVSGRVEVAGSSVFVKRIRLTDVERRTSNAGSTANLFGLPVRCQYGVGSPGFGAWRELAACAMASDWVLTGRSDAFPLLHHWRVLPGVGPAPDDAASIDDQVEFWGGSSAVRTRLAALADATASLVLFCEFVPNTLDDWLGDQVRAGRAATKAAIGLLEAQLLLAVEFMNAAGLHHFDAHFGNVLTDGRRLFLADFGLATSPSFDLSDQEAGFLVENRTHDAAYGTMRLVNWAVTAFGGLASSGDVERCNCLVRALAGGSEMAGVPATVTRLLGRLAPTAAVMNDFYRELFTTSRAARYPAARVAEALSSR